jgi:hypothetical protein
MTAPKLIEDLKTKPGTYRLTNPFMWALFGSYSKVEFLPNGEVWEINKKGERDTLLDDEGWNPEIMLVPEEENTTFED